MSDIQREYISKNHSKFLIKYHIIFICKYRKKLLQENIEQSMKNILFSIASSSDFSIEVMETDKNHIHMLICSVPKLSPLQIVRRLKQLSTSMIWACYPEYLSKIFYREQTFWTDGYFVSSIGNVSQNAIKLYIENQG